MTFEHHSIFTSYWRIAFGFERNRRFSFKARQALQGVFKRSFPSSLHRARAEPLTLPLPEGAREILMKRRGPDPGAEG